jgi:hypothetical protein
MGERGSVPPCGTAIGTTEATTRRRPEPTAAGTVAGTQGTDLSLMIF